MSELRKRTPPPVALRRGTHQRHRALSDQTCAWIYRWGFSSQKALAAHYPPRPYLGRDLRRGGYLSQHDQPCDVRFSDGRHVYAVTEEGLITAERILPWDIYRLGMDAPSTPAWTSMQHLMDMQKIAISQGMLPTSPDWRTEPELRMMYAESSSPVVPDLTYSRADEDGLFAGLDWYELDRSAKSDIRLDYWTQMLARRVARAKDTSLRVAERPLTIAQIIVVVLTDSQRERYRAAFDRDSVEALVRDPQTRKIRPIRDAARLPLRDMFAGIVQVTTLEELLAYPAVLPSERMRAMGLWFDGADKHDG